jgi:hypothetical protein
MLCLIGSKKLVSRMSGFLGAFAILLARL